MSIELKVPSVGESITEVQIARWLKKEGDQVSIDENIVEIESDKATVELPAPAAGRISKILKKDGQIASVGEVIGYLEAGDVPAKPADTAADKKAASSDQKMRAEVDDTGHTQAKSTGTTVPVSQLRGGTAIGSPQPRGEQTVMPAAARELAEKGLKSEDVKATGPGGRLLKEDVVRHSESQVVSASSGLPGQLAPRGLREQEVVPMSPLRRRIAERLVEAQQTAALLTTFNEIDMTEVMAIRAKYKDTYQKRYGIKLGFMSFFVKAAIDALKQYPGVNAEIQEPHIVYNNYYDIGIAVGGGKGLVVPVIRNAELLSFGEIELAIAEYARRAQANKLKLEELQGGTFTISNGGVYGSLLSTPIINPPQSGILGLHAIQERPIALNGQVVIRPMMYVALTYDHRIVDGREAVGFLKRIKETMEDPSRILLEI